MKRSMTVVWAVVGVAALVAVLPMGGLPAGAQSKEPIKVGLIQPLSGPIAAAGSYITNGAKIAVERINASRTDTFDVLSNSTLAIAA